MSESGSIKQITSRGQTLVEAVVVIGIVALLVTGLISGTTASLKTAQSGRVRSQAVSLAQEGLEYARTIRDQKWNTLLSYSGTYCMGNDNVLVPAGGSCGVNVTVTENSFSRSISFSWQDPKMVITSQVSYIEGQLTKDVTLVTYLTQWK